jgi:hypothetical protein
MLLSHLGVVFCGLVDSELFTSMTFSILTAVDVELVSFSLIIGIIYCEMKLVSFSIQFLAADKSSSLIKIAGWLD